MGQEPAELREAIEETRRQMDDTVVALGYKVDVPSRAKERIGEVRARVVRMDWRRLVPYAAGAAAVAGGAVTAVVALKVRASRPPERLAIPARRLPEPARNRVLPLARRADRLLARTVDEVDGRRRHAVQAVSREIASALADEQAKRNPAWLGIVRDVGTSAATTAATLLVRRALSAPKEPRPQPAAPERFAGADVPGPAKPEHAFSG